MEFFLVLAVIAAIVFVLLIQRSNEGSKRTRKPVGQTSVRKRKENFHATRVVPGDNACQAALDLQDKLFLDKELNTPKLPLPECTQIADCNCKYVHHDDRRSEEGDRRLHTLQTDLYPASEGSDRRRQKRGRRATD